jgi:hypothetical protein
MLLYLCQQVTGVQFVLGYSTYFFELAGFATSKAFALNVGTLSLAVSASMQSWLEGASLKLTFASGSSSAILRVSCLPTRLEGGTYS